MASGECSRDFRALENRFNFVAGREQDPHSAFAVIINGHQCWAMSTAARWTISKNICNFKYISSTGWGKKKLEIGIPCPNNDLY